MSKKRIQPAEKVGLNLTPTEKVLLLEGLTLLPSEYEQTIVSTPADEPVMLTLDDLEDLSGYIAADANHTPDAKKEKQLDDLLRKIDSLLDKYVEEEPPSSIETEIAKVATPKKANKPKAKTAIGDVFQFKITLVDSEPPIWRRIQVADCTLDKLHEHLQTSMGWTNSHLHQFEIDGERYGDPDLLADDIGDFDCVDSTRTKISKILPKSGLPHRFAYEYDFGDGWEHEVLFEGRPKKEPGKKYPLCLEGERASPPEDVGGIDAYYEFLAAMSDPKHERHREYVEWIGAFDPEGFDAAAATQAMHEGPPHWLD